MAPQLTLLNRFKRFVPEASETEMVTTGVRLGPGDVGATLTSVITGAVVSIVNALLAPRLVAAPGVTKVKMALFPGASLMVPEFSARDEVDT